MQQLKSGRVAAWTVALLCTALPAGAQEAEFGGDGHRALTLLLLLPGLLGLFGAVLQMRSGASALVYGVAVTAGWSAVALTFSLLYLWDGRHRMPLFGSGLELSSGVVVFAILGCLTRVAYSLSGKETGRLVAARQERFRALGSRLLVAPYVAVVVLVLFAAALPAAAGGPIPLVLSFFTGLWIQPLLDLLHGAVGRFRRERTEAGERPPDLPEPATALADRVRVARCELAAYDGVLGVGVGRKVAAGRGTGEDAVVVYVDRKLPLRGEDPRRVPAVLGGFLTDVIELAAPEDAAPCHSAAFEILWDKVYRLHRSRTSGHPAAAPEITRRGNVLVVSIFDADQLFYRWNVRADQMFVPRLAYDAVRPRLGDHYDFIAFVVDDDSGLTPQGHYYVPVHNDVGGIQFYKDPPSGRFSERSAWGSVRLLGCQVHGKGQRELSRRFLLHELGHAWSAYVTYRSGGQRALTDLLHTAWPGQGYHWHERFDNGISCMDYDRKRWVHLGGDLYRQETLPDEELGYCELDLYLMGLLTKEDVPPLRLVRPRSAGDEPGTFHADVEEISVQAIVDDCGPWSHAGVPPNAYRQAFVVVTADRASGEALADHVDALLPEHEASFSQAIDKAARKVRLLTELVA